MFYIYKNLHGNSPITSYEIHPHSIRVCFAGNVVYDYLAAKIGAQNLLTMKQLAEQGYGLASFINQNPAIRKGYSQKKCVL